jgi:hypothetical protein
MRIATLGFSMLRSTMSLPSDFRGMDVELLFFVLPIGLPSAAALLFWLALRDPQKIFSKFIVLGLGAIFITCGWIAFLASSGGMGGVVAFIGVLFVAVTGLIAGLMLVVALRGKRKLFAGVIIFLFPLATLFSMEVGYDNSPGSLTEQHGKVIAQALDQYRAANGEYPETLDELVPQYIADLKEPSSVWGWLYTATEDEFALGYVFGVDRYGYSVCIYKSNAPEWDCEPFSSGPFDIPPTPGTYTSEATPMR